MLVADALSHYAPLKAPEIPLDITINHVFITHDRKTELQALIQDNPLLCSLAELIVSQMISMMSHMLYTHTMATETPLQLKMTPSFDVKLSSFLQQKGRRSSKQYMKDTWESASAKTEPDTVCIGLESTKTSNASLSQAQPTLALDCPWQLLGADHFNFDRSQCLFVTDYYSKMPIIRRIPTSQCNALKTI